jgi:hypothetical protein
MKINHGQMNGAHRKCNIHGHHGVFYICNSYSRSLKNKLRILGYRFIESCRNGTIVIREDHHE